MQGKRGETGGGVGGEERGNRKYFICPDEAENEVHLLTKCKIFQEERNLPYQSCREICDQFASIQTSE